MGDSMRWAACVLVLAACKLDTSGVGEGNSTGTTGDSSGGGPTTAPTTTMTTTTAPTTTDGTDGSTAPTSDTSAGTQPTGESESDDSTGDPELGEFGNLMPITELNTNSVEDDPTVRFDLREIYFSRTLGDPSTEDIYRATRDSVDEPFDEPVLVDELSFQGSADASPELSSDGLVISFSGAWPGGPGGNDVMIAYRDDLEAAWSDPVRVDELTSDVDDASVAMTEDGRVGYLCRDFLGAQYWELMRTSRRRDDGTWDDPVALSINADGRDCAPWVDAEETELWFTSVRPGGTGAEDIWRVAIAGGELATPTPVQELNTMQADEDPWISPDGHTLVFATNRDGNFDIWTGTR